MINPPTKHLTVRLKGGLGNQLFCYAAARRLALKGNAELVIDDVTGFIRDKQYKRQFALEKFNISARLATPSERMEPFERYRRALAKWRERRKPYDERSYLEQEGRDFDPRLLTLRPRGDLYLDGLWQSEAYFKDVEAIIRRDLTIQPPSDRVNQEAAARIQDCENSVALHVRWFDAPGANAREHNVSRSYYQRALNYAQAKLGQPHFFLFSDDPRAAAKKLALPEASYTLVAHNVGDEFAYADMWLMSQCRHFITANSTFSWWGAWLGEKTNGEVLAPSPTTFQPVNAWCTKDLLPARWIKL